MESSHNTASFILYRMIFFTYGNGPSGGGVAYYSRKTSSEYN